MTSAGSAAGPDFTALPSGLPSEHGTWIKMGPAAQTSQPVPKPLPSFPEKQLVMSQFKTRDKAGFCPEKAQNATLLGPLTS